MKIRDIQIDMDVQSYLESKGFDKINPVGDNVMACCPFHDEREPSFGVSTETGLYNCFGCGAGGSIGHLVKHIDKFDTVFDAETYLIRTYGRFKVDISDRELILSFGDEKREQVYEIDDECLQPYKFIHPYLLNRGINEKWQLRFGIGYSRKPRAITIPWRDEVGRLITVKFRSVAEKKFWYDPPLPKGLKSETLWGLDKVLQWGLHTVALTEAELDSLSVWQANDLLHKKKKQLIGSAGIGGNQFNESQAKKLIRMLPVGSEIIDFTDNDAGGELARERISDYLGGRFRLSKVDWSLIGRAVKDANDLTTEEITYLLENRKPLGIKLF